jgi:hypothetical protein
MSHIIKRLHFEASVPRKDRVKALAPILNKALADFDNDKINIGVEAFDVEVVKVIEAAGLLDKLIVFALDEIGTHPDNRNQAMAVPVDVHGLLKRMVEDGFSWQRWVALGCTIPDGPEGETWRAANVKLAIKSRQLLAPCVGHQLKVVTVRGSHGSHALKLCKFGGKAIHKSYANDEGMVSLHKILESRPSFQEPVEKGVPIDVFPGELAVACPKLMSTLALIGNSSNDVFRLPTTLQLCARIHDLALHQQQQEGAPNWAKAAKQATVGYGGEEYLEKTKSLTEFVRIWSGGADKAILKDLEAYEKQLTIKRKLYVSDLAAIAALGPCHDCPRYIPALIKSMLNSPTCDQTGHSNLFSVSDLTSLAAGGKLRPWAVRAHEVMASAATFLQAYSRMQEQDQLNLSSLLEVRSVMFVHSKTAASRKTFENFQEIAHAFFDECKIQDDKLPKWSYLKEKEATGLEPNLTGIREVNFDGTIADSELIARGFDVGKIVFLTSDSDTRWRIKELTPNLQTVLLEMQREDEEEEEEDDEEEEKEEREKQVSRTELLSLWTVEKKVATTFLTDISDGMCKSHQEVVATIVKGCMLQSMLLEFEKSSESKVVLQTSPRLGVFAGSKIKDGSLKLVGLSHSVQVLPAAKTAPPSALCMGTLSEYNLKVYIRSSLQLPKAQRSFVANSSQPFIAKYWAVQESVDARVANCTRTTHSFSLKVGKTTHELEFPLIVNNKEIAEHAELIFLKDSKVLASEEPDAKKPRISLGSAASKAAPKTAPKAAAGGKGKGKGKKGGKSKGK